MKNKFFNGKKYFIDKFDKQWRRTTDKNEPLSHDTWNFFHPDDPILKDDNNVIHHINGDSFDDRIENLQKLMRSKHSSLHATGNQNNLGKHWFLSDKTKQKMCNAMLGNTNNKDGKNQYN